MTGDIYPRSLKDSGYGIYDEYASRQQKRKIKRLKRRMIRRTKINYDDYMKFVKPFYEEQKGPFEL